MLNKLWSFFKLSSGLENISIITANLHEIFELFEKEYGEDQNLKDAAIDSLIELLNEYKNKKWVFESVTKCNRLNYPEFTSS